MKEVSVLLFLLMFYSCAEPGPVQLPNGELIGGIPIKDFEKTHVISFADYTGFVVPYPDEDLKNYVILTKSPLNDVLNEKQIEELKSDEIVGALFEESEFGEEELIRKVEPLYKPDTILRIDGYIRFIKEGRVVCEISCPETMPNACQLWIPKVPR